MLKVGLVILLFFSSLTHVMAQQLRDLVFMTEEYPPYNYTEQNQLRGISIDVLDQALKNFGLQPVTVKSYPWVRGYEAVLRGPNVVLFSMTRTVARENLFQWVGPISPTEIVLIAKKGRVKFDEENLLRRYSVGVVRSDIGELLVSQKFGSVNLQYSSQPDQVARQLISDRIDIWAYEKNVALWIIKQMGGDPNDFEILHVLEKSELYFALSKDVDKRLVRQLQNAVDHITEIGLTEKIIKKNLK